MHQWLTSLPQWQSTQIPTEKTTTSPSLIDRRVINRICIHQASVHSLFALSSEQ